MNAPIYDKAGRVRRQTPYKRAIIQALRFHFNLRPSEIARAMGVKCQDVSRVTLMVKQIWECRPAWEQARAIAQASRILNERKVGHERATV